MKPKQDLFDLVQSLSSAEISAMQNELSQRKGVHTYTKLFESLLKLEDYDEYQLKKKFRGEKTVNNFSVAKANLYDKIMEVLCGMPQNQNLETEFDHLKQQIGILTKKGLIDQALQRVHKSIRLAEKLEAFRKIMELYDYERELSRIILEPNEFLSVASRLRSQSKEILEKEKNLKDYQDLFDKIEISTRSQPGIGRALLNAVSSDPLMQDETKAVSASAKILYFRIWKKIYEIQKIPKGWKLFSLQIMSQLESKPYLLVSPANFLVYLDTLTDFGLRCIRGREYDDAEITLKKLRKLRKSIKSGDNEPMIHMRFWRIRLYHSLQTLIWEQAELALKRLESGLKKFRNKISRREELEVRFLIIITYLTFGREEKARELIIEFKNEPVPQTRSDLYFFNYYLFLIVHFNTRKLRGLEEEMQEMRAVMEANKVFGPMEESFFQFFEETIAALDPHQTLKGLDELRLKIMNFLESNQEIRLEDYYDLIAWIDAQRQGKTMKEVLLKKSAELSAAK